MDNIMASYTFTDPRIEAAAVKFVENYLKSRANSFGHSVGMEVHDVRNTTQTLEPGQVFTIEPAMQIEEEHVGIRLERHAANYVHRLQEPIRLLCPSRSTKSRK